MRDQPREQPGQRPAPGAQAVGRSSIPPCGRAGSARTRSRSRPAGTRRTRARGRSARRPRGPATRPCHTVTSRSTTKIIPIVTQNGDQRMLSAASRRHRHQHQVGLERDHPVGQGELLAPVHRGRTGEAVGADVLQRAAVPPQPLPPQVAPGRHDLGRHATLRRGRHPRPQGLQRQGELVVLGQRQRVVDLSRPVPAATARAPPRRRAARRPGSPRPSRSGRTRGPACGRPVAGSGCTRCVGTGRPAGRRPRRRTVHRRRPGPGRPPAARAPPPGSRGASVESASITITTSRCSAWGSRRASCWFSAPAFFSVLPTVSTTSTPWAAATSTVASAQLSATTTTRSGRRDCAARDSKVSPRTASSSCAGMRTVHRRTVPAGSSSAVGSAGRQQSSTSRRPPAPSRGVPGSARRARRTACAAAAGHAGPGRAPASPRPSAARPGRRRSSPPGRPPLPGRHRPGLPSPTLSGTSTCSSCTPPILGRREPHRHDQQANRERRKSGREPPELRSVTPQVRPVNTR